MQRTALCRQSFTALFPCGTARKGRRSMRKAAPTVRFGNAALCVGRQGRCELPRRPACAGGRPRGPAWKDAKLCAVLFAVMRRRGNAARTPASPPCFGCAAPLRAPQQVRSVLGARGIDAPANKVLYCINCIARRKMRRPNAFCRDIPINVAASIPLPAQRACRPSGTARKDLESCRDLCALYVRRVLCVLTARRRSNAALIVAGALCLGRARRCRARRKCAQDEKQRCRESRSA